MNHINRFERGVLRFLDGKINKCRLTIPSHINDIELQNIIDKIKFKGNLAWVSTHTTTGLRELILSKGEKHLIAMED